ncbi:hypothetical protein [Bacillus alveayuensis]|uniref:hypothetical protein n=1 Tax=Aeribacillus alveayuensis TaxID=279215 RepID=UPI000AD58D62|nr:hypothetical protein [Bacillus alveayuensis]
METEQKREPLPKQLDVSRDEKIGSNDLLRFVSYPLGSVACLRNGYIGGHQA